MPQAEKRESRRACECFHRGNLPGPFAYAGMRAKFGDNPNLNI